MEYTSTDFQCPASGWGVYLIYDVDNEQIRAEICETGIWDTDDKELFTEETEKDTSDWCRRFGKKYCDSLDGAYGIADKYDCWFN